MRRSGSKVGSYIASRRYNMSEMVDALGSAVFIEQLAVRWMFLIYLGVAFAITYRAGFVNLGISGQLIVGAYIACVIASLVPNWGVALVMAFLFVLGTGMLPVYLRYQFEANEVLSTLFLTYIVISVGQFLMRPTGGELIVASPQVPASAIPDWLTPIAYARSVTLFHVPAIPLAVALQVCLRHSVFGYQVRVAGDNSLALNAGGVVKLINYGTVLASLCIVLALMGDTYTTKARYVSHEYDATGFLGVAVALIAISLESLTSRLGDAKTAQARSGWINWAGLLAFLAIPCAGLFVAFVEVAFRLMSVSFGVPARMAFLVFGGALFLAALALRRN